MTQPDPFNRLKQRRAAIAKRLARLTRLYDYVIHERSRLNAEDRDLSAAEEVLLRVAARMNDDDLLRDFPQGADQVAPSAQNEAEAEQEAESADDTDGSIPRVGTPRPENIPTTPQMFDVLLVDAEGAGKAGLLGRDLVVGIRSRWWPGAGWNSILPTAFALAAKGRLGRKGKLFVRVRRAAQGDEAATLRH